MGVSPSVLIKRVWMLYKKRDNSPRLCNHKVSSGGKEHLGGLVGNTWSQSTPILPRKRGCSHGTKHDCASPRAIVLLGTAVYLQKQGAGHHWETAPRVSSGEAEPTLA